MNSLHPCRRHSACFNGAPREVQEFGSMDTSLCIPSDPKITFPVKESKLLSSRRLGQLIEKKGKPLKRTHFLLIEAESPNYSRWRTMKEIFTPLACARKIYLFHSLTSVFPGFATTIFRFFAF